MLESDEQQGCNCNIIHNICHNTNHHRLIYSERNTDESCPECDTMITMRISAGENLSRLGKHLTAIYNKDAPPTIPGIRSNSLSYFFSSSTDLQSTFVIPCLSLSSKEREYDNNNNNNNNSNEELYDEESAMLLSRMSRFGQHTMSAAPMLSLQNFVKSFGHIFEYHLQRKIKSVLYKARERQEQRWMDYNASSNTIHNNSSSLGGKKPNQLQALIDAFKKLATSNLSIATPLSATARFLTYSSPSEWSRIDAHFQKLKLPIIYETELHLQICDGEIIEYIHIRAPGYISGIFGKNMSRPNFVEIDIDTRVLQDTMKKECKFLARKVVSGMISACNLKTVKNTASLSSTTATTNELAQSLNTNQDSSPTVDRVMISPTGVADIFSSSFVDQKLQSNDDVLNKTQDMKIHRPKSSKHKKKFSLFAKIP